MSSDQNYASEILDAPLEEEMRRSYLDYAMSVIVGRALPDARDGMKPVHRRVLHSMNELGNDWNKAYKKSARIVGDTIGKYHPHGDSAVYETMVRMAQEFSLRYPLIDGQGNFGSVDGDSAAAMRYTEVRLSKIAHLLLEDIDKQTVDFGPNYDGSEQEPLVLPARLPNLLLNGSEGIAVGMATRIPPHNLSELIDACLLLLEGTPVDEETLFKVVPAPDFPTGGLICGLAGAQEAFRTGRGSVVIRAKTHFEDDGGHELIVVDELPYQVNKKTLQEKIAALVVDKKIDGISNIQDESDKSGMRLVIFVRRGHLPDVVLNQLFRKTDLQVTFGVNMVALVEGSPKIVTLRECLNIFIAHRREVIVRRTIHELGKARTRSHILEGFAVVLSNLDEVVDTIKNAKDPAAAKEQLLARPWQSPLVEQMLRDTGSQHRSNPAGYTLSVEQVDEILQMRLSRLTGLEQEKISIDFRSFLLLVKDLEDILARDERVRGIIRDELVEARTLFGDSRRSEIVFGVADIEDEDLIPRRPMIVTMSQNGYVKAQNQEDYASQHRGGRGKSAADLKESDETDVLLSAGSHDWLMCFTSKGRMLPIKVYSLPAGSRQSRGRPIQNFLPLTEGESVAKVLPVSRIDETQVLALVTRAGIVKRTSMEEFSNMRAGGLIAIALDDGDEVVEALLTTGSGDLTLFCSNGKAARFSEEQLRLLSRTARGVRGMKFDPSHRIVAATASTSEEALVLTVSEFGYGKRTPIGQFRKCNRGALGVRALAVDERVGRLAGAALIEEEQDALAVTNAGIMIRVPAEQIRQTSRGALGVRLIRLDAGQKVSSIAVSKANPIKTEVQEEEPDHEPNE